MDYKTELMQRAKALVERSEQHLDVDFGDIFNGIEWSELEATDAYFAKLVEKKIVTRKQVATKRNEQRKHAKLFEILGCVPGTPLAFVRAQAENLNIEIDWKGAMKIGGDFETIIDLKRTMRLRSAELVLPFKREEVDDATEQYFIEAKRLRPKAVDDMLTPRQPFDFQRFARTYFRESGTMTYPVIAAIIQKFIHQARSKLRGNKVLNHLMPVIHGGQGSGKTYLLEQMLAPINEAVSWSNFDQITDDRNIDLWQNLVIVLDEMARANKADVETIKHVITAETLDRRPMRTNSTVAVRNRAVMIGASNHRLDELIKDDTGNRRFVELIFNPDADRKAILTFDFKAMWAAVQPEDGDPTAMFRDAIAAAQATYAVAGPVQDWLDNYDVQSLLQSMGPMGCSTADLYTAFLEYRSTVVPGVDFQARTQIAFASELRRIVEQYPIYNIEKRHTRGGNRWVSTMPAATVHSVIAKLASVSK